MKTKLTLLFLALITILAVPVIAQDDTTVSTNSADAVRTKVQEKVDKARNIPTSYIGSVTDITGETIQLNTYITDEIKQVVVSEDETDFTKNITKSQSIELADVAIGDFVVAMGYKNGNEVLETSRLLVITPLEKVTRTVSMGQVIETDKKTVLMSVLGGEEQTLEFGKTWKGPEISDLSGGTNIIVAGEVEDGVMSVRTLYIVPEETPAPSPTESPNPTPKASESPSPTPTEAPVE